MELVLGLVAFRFGSAWNWFPTRLELVPSLFGVGFWSVWSRVLSLLGIVFELVWDG